MADKNFPVSAIVRFRSADNAALRLLCLTGQMRSNILFFKRSYVVLDVSLGSD
jgi:hypothetical protein